MALEPQQKKQAVTLILLVGVLGVVFYFMDPFKLFEEISELPPEAKAKIEKAKKEGVLMAQERKDKAEKTKIAVLNTEKKAKISIHDAEENLFELLPKVPSLDIVLLLDNNKTPYKQNIFSHKFSIGNTKGPVVKLPEVARTSRFKDEDSVQFKTAIDPQTGQPTTKFFKEGGEFIFNTILYRILKIDIKTNTIIIVDLSDKTSRGDEHEIPLKK